MVLTEKVNDPERKCSEHGPPLTRTASVQGQKRPQEGTSLYPEATQVSKYSLSTNIHQHLKQKALWEIKQTQQPAQQRELK